MKKRKLLALAVTALLLLVIPVMAHAKQPDGWVQNSDYSWSYYQNGSMLTNTVRWINNAYYGFDSEGIMYDDQHFSVYNEAKGKREYFYATEGGGLFTSGWIQLKDVYDDYQWYYYGADAVGLEGLQKLGQHYYNFIYSKADKDMVRQGDGAVYVADENCVVTLVYNGWISKDNGRYWYYARDGRLCTNNVYYIDGKYWCFEGELLRARAGTYYRFTGLSKDPIYYLTNEDGSVVTQVGWHKLNGQYYYVKSDMALAYGFFDYGGNLYYMKPAMSSATYDVFWESDRYGSYHYYLYAIAPTGEMQWLSKEGFHDVGGDYAYVRNDGIAAVKEWIYHNGKWYYANHNGTLYKNGTWEIGGKQYYFDENCAMIDSGWYQIYGGTWVYANPDGTLFTGLDSVGYMFDHNGYLMSNKFTGYNGNIYWVNSNGIATKLVKGWNYVNGKWYYVNDDGSFAKNIQEINGVRYVFGYNGALLTNAKYPDYITDENGAICTGWIWHDGYWYYGDEDGSIYNYGERTINGKNYLFMNGSKLQVSATVVFKNNGYKTDADGVIISKAKADGWYHHIDDTDGTFYYYKDGKAYTGWVGDYYIEDGVMQTDCFVKWNQEYYYLTPSGKYLKNSWYEYFYDDESVIGETPYWIFAKADGSLCIDEWYQDAKGDWYYFRGRKMAYGGTYIINGEQHEFSYDGVWLGQVYEEPEIEVEVADGWKYENGGWRYYVANECLRAKSILYNGKRYAFNYDGYMVTDCFYGSCYYDANGERVNYVGWHYINGGWAYFNDAYVAQSGWVNDGKALYYITARSDKDTGKTVGFDLATGIVYLDPYGLFYFDSEGRLCEKITKDGWHLFDGDWYYYQYGEGVNNRSLCIDGKYYAFAYGGKMVSDRIFNGCYYLKSGEKATQGWYWTKNEYDQYGWTYVLENGKVANGVHVIDGIEYGFKYGIWVN